MWQAILKGMAGLVVGIPMGLVLYYVPVIALAELLATSENIRLMRLLDWNPVVVMALAMIAGALEWGLFRASARRGLRLLFWGQATSVMMICVPLFVYTAVHHNPILPFYGQ